jgi:hypothetical protein
MRGETMAAIVSRLAEHSTPAPQRLQQEFCVDTASQKTGDFNKPLVICSRPSTVMADGDAQSFRMAGGRRPSSQILV